MIVMRRLWCWLFHRSSWRSTWLDNGVSAQHCHACGAWWFSEDGRAPRPRRF